MYGADGLWRFQTEANYCLEIVFWTFKICCCSFSRQKKSAKSPFIRIHSHSHLPLLKVSRLVRLCVVKLLAWETVLPHVSHTNPWVRLCFVRLLDSEKARACTTRRQRPVHWACLAIDSKVSGVFDAEPLVGHLGLFACRRTFLTLLHCRQHHDHIRMCH